MAFLDPNDVFLTAAASPVGMPTAVQPALEPQGFDRTEWAIIALARDDGLATLREPKQRSKLGRMLRGRSRNYALAAERLEVLRRLAVEAWHQPHAISLPAIAGFMAAGFSATQLKLLLSATGALQAIAKLTGAAGNFA